MASACRLVKVIEGQVIVPLEERDEREVSRRSSV